MYVRLQTPVFLKPILPVSLLHDDDDDDDDDDDTGPAHLLNLSFSASDRGCHWHVPEQIPA